MLWPLLHRALCFWCKQRPGHSCRWCHPARRWRRDSMPSHWTLQHRRYRRCHLAHSSLEKLSQTNHPYSLTSLSFLSRRKLFRKRNFCSLYSDPLSPFHSVRCRGLLSTVHGHHMNNILVPDILCDTPCIPQKVPNTHSAGLYNRIHWSGRRYFRLSRWGLLGWCFCCCRLCLYVLCMGSALMYVVHIITCCRRHTRF